MKQKLEVLKPIGPQSSYEEVVDSLADVFEIGRIVEDALSDGFQPLSDILKIATQESKVREVIDDIPIFIQQFLSLTPETAVRATLEVRDRLVKEKPLGKVTNAILGALFLLANGYGTLERSVTDYYFQRDGWKALIAGQFVLPPSSLLK